MSNIFALRDSGLSVFLFSDVGTEANGISLTILSLLARLDRDPWAEAAAWSVKARADAIESLADCISQMPPSQQALDDARLIASRLVLLLPDQGASTAAATLTPDLAASPRLALLALFYFSLLVVFNFFIMAGWKSEAPVTPIAQPVAASTK